MTEGSTYTNWQTHRPAPDSRLNRCSPNLMALFDEMAKRWGCTDIGCYGWRPIRGGTAPSSHGFGAARDIRYDHVGRYVALNTILPWLIDHSFEFHISAIHDYVGCRIWHAGRGWKAQTPSTTTGMGQAWATYFHVETTEAGWWDNTPIANRDGITPPSPIPVPPQPTPGGFVHATIKLGDQNADVYAMQMFCKKYAGNTDIVIDGKFGQITDTAVRMVQTIFGLTVDGVAGPKTWAAVDTFANTH
jgi:hypothetical protein